jgi:radical SAM protein with 4Fe4S-binding SPASM domain
MTSNATLITEERAYTLVKAGLQKINISIDSPDRAIHDQIRGVPGGWERATQGFRYLRRYLKPGRMRINTVIGQLNYASLVTLPDLAAELGADRLNLIPMDEHTADLQRLNQRQIAHYNRCIAPVIARKALKLGLIQQEQDAYPFGRVSRDTAHSLHGHYARGYYNQHPCFAPWTHALIDHVGRVSLCCMMPNKPVIGDLRQQSFKEIWQGEAFASLRRTRHLPQFEACTHCDMFLKENQQLATLLA